VTATALGRILRAALADAPGSVGGSFAAADGEMVDLVAEDPDDLAFVTAHCAIMVAQVRSAMRTFHFGDPLELVLVADRGTVLMQVVADGYFALLAMRPGAPLAAAQRALDRAVVELRAEIA
jgi:predicted regulator of Ras-like GTPase activity (Roadblock/LC7/MglB family)